MGATAGSRMPVGRAGPGRTLLTLGLVAVAGVLAVLGVTAAAAQSDDDGDATDGDPPDELLTRLGELEADLPEDGPVGDVVLEEDVTWGELVGDATSVRSQLDTLEPELRSLFIDADEAEGDVAEAVAAVARGWLDHWTGAASIATAESHDLDFPVDTTDDLDVATGADELRGSIEVGMELALRGHARHLAGYGDLRELDEAEPELQSRLDERAEAAETYDAEVRPRAVLMLSQQTTSVMVPVTRFESGAPGVESRASSVEVVCVDRQQLEELGGVVTEETLPELEPVDRDDCPQLPDPLDGPDPSDG
ncbi:MAG: hypothetical protein ACLFRD_05995 [Nitriliruptoraceae bacterium]